MRQQPHGQSNISALLIVAALVADGGLTPISAQVRAGRRGAVAKGDERRGRGRTAGRRRQG